jgi:hypothetical protein
MISKEAVIVSFHVQYAFTWENWRNPRKPQSRQPVSKPRFEPGICQIQGALLNNKFMKFGTQPVEKFLGINWSWIRIISLEWHATGLSP